MRKERLIESLRNYVSERVVEAMSRVPRELFVPEELRPMAYEDRPLPIGHGQTISAPHMVAMMCDLLDLREGMKVLEVGGGCGYHAAVMAELVGPSGHVYSVERIPELVEMARRNLERARYRNVSMILGDGTLGYSEQAPYDRISVAASAPDIPEPLKEQLRPGGRMVIPVGSYSQDLLVVTKNHDIRVERAMGVIFVPLIGKYGFKDSFW
ncbi:MULTISPECIES: protein-L-isoaspartate O-methyltransferase [Methanothrix]|uniref:Protein-L-isoaspartate O-methyltransferase n=1 Tax=Methanothrix thermoacetophila (strain DSM 6194 / JCM 14653 / NBRC 101360 / PT) TaxID=349307 RepID=PIMT_METTP|nr:MULTISPECIES: protein-L-isoaspartate O-methyltransferase [Methanothrix]A0B9U1.1 RecName: Full=Protein-L-isoaspartate O-methyltransferase; AltName: Full=L-isoaspartyl protein carboxyl methyltransferase; AltName: Full=Protein L-isoaspartyl methyltransferase; AltName: Full=Protein-beta-aspartate methyltransferase; Short=PIMT [Methanothrix thermoacetophila PT]ABK15465.1 protein-L-isoaspartate O-methyltransferase [Methanothrix thermoacetophila PT]NPU88207.1 protein-L-isoaspartate O-methyltransfera